MPSFINHIETAVPEFSYKQDDVRETMKEIVGDDERSQRIIHLLYAKSGIETRYSVMDDFKSTGSHSLFFNGQGAAPGTKSRNDTYISEGRKLFVQTAGKLLSGSGIPAKEITHLITVSCTGFYAPGPDFDIIKEHGLKNSIERYHLGFMGCYAVIPALKLAGQICQANGNANVMVISVELCTIHFQANSKMDNLLSSSVFADGAAGAIVSSQPTNNPEYRMDGFASAIMDKGAEDMAWSIGDNGFDMVLSNYIPDLLESGLQDFLQPVLQQFQIGIDEVGSWAVHPGGRAILDKVEKTLDLPNNILQPSRKVLARYGNMSSATILFVLKEILEEPSEISKNRTLAMAFGPGLTIETALLRKQ